MLSSSGVSSGRRRRYLPVHAPRHFHPKLPTKTQQQNHPKSQRPREREIGERVVLGFEFLMLGPAESLATEILALQLYRTEKASFILLISRKFRTLQSGVNGKVLWVILTFPWIG